MSAQPIVGVDQNITATPITPTRYLNIDFLSIPGDAPYLLPGDVIHVEATLQVRGVTDGLDYKDEPRSIITARANGTPEVVIRSATLTVGKDAPQDASQNSQNSQNSEQEAPSAPQGRRGRIRAWWNRPWTAMLASALYTAAWSAGIVTLGLMLSGCGTLPGAPAASPQAPPVVRTVASCTEAMTTALRAEINAATSMADFDKRMKGLAKPEQCNGLSDADLDEVLSRVQVNIMPDALARGFDLAGGAR